MKPVIKKPKAGDPAPTPPGAYYPRIWKEETDRRSGKKRLVIGTSAPKRPKYSGDKHWFSGEAGRIHFAKIRLMKPVNGRTGIPNGMSRAAFSLLIDEALEKAKKAIDYMESKDEIDLSGVPADEVEKERAALNFAAALVLTPGIPLGVRLKAAETTLKFTRGVRQNTNVNVENAEELLAAAWRESQRKAKPSE